MNNKLKILLLLFVLFSAYVRVFSLSRQDVINEAKRYTQNPSGWEVKEGNILHIKTYKYNLSTKKWEITNTSDSIDDRAQKHIDKNGVVHYSENGNSNWCPYEVGGTYTGEAYALGETDTYDTFKKCLNSSTKKYIAGRRNAEGSDLQESLPAGYDGFTGIDCSGLVSRAWDWKYPNTTTKIPKFTIKISTDELKSGDVGNQIDPVDSISTGQAPLQTELLTPLDLKKISNGTSGGQL